MGSGSVRSWAWSVVLLVLAVGQLAVSGPSPVSVSVGVVLLVMAWALSPLLFPRSPGDAAGRAAAERDGVPLVYWRIGCTYCLRLRLTLGRAGNRAVWVDVGRDADASARVRSVNDGNETVPTVFVGATHRTNPEPRWVRDRLRPGQPIA